MEFYDYFLMFPRGGFMVEQFEVFAVFVALGVFAGIGVYALALVLFPPKGNK